MYFSCSLKTSFTSMLYGVKLILIGLLSLPLCTAVLSLAPFDPRGKLAYRFVWLWTWMVLKVGRISIRVRGLEGLDTKRQYIFVANHQSYLDIPAMTQALTPFQLRWIAKKELLWIPFFGWALWSSRNIVVDRSKLATAMTSLRKARERIREGEVSVVIFPEGTRSSHGEILPFKRGGFVLAFKTQTAVVPVTIKGSGAVLPRGDWRIRKGEIEIVVDEPVPVDQFRPGSLQHLISRVRETIASNCGADHSRGRGHAEHGPEPARGLWQEGTCIYEST